MDFNATELIAIHQIRNYYGNEIEFDKVIEELDELKEAVQEYRKSEKKDNAAVLNEIADVYIVLEHLKAMTKITKSELDQQVYDKIIRQLGRMVKEVSENDEI